MRKCPTLLCGGRWDHGLANSTLPYISRYSHLWVKHPALWHPALAISCCSFPPASSSSANGFLLPVSWGHPPEEGSNPSLSDPVCSSVCGPPCACVHGHMCTPTQLSSLYGKPQAHSSQRRPLPWSLGHWVWGGRSGWRGRGDYWQHISTSPLPTMHVMHCWHRMSSVSCCNIKS